MKHVPLLLVSICAISGCACFDPASCEGVFHQDGVNEEQFLAGAEVIGQLGSFDRTNPENPFANFSYVWIPYRSGDIHVGTTENGYGGRKQVGYRNYGLDLERIVPTFADAERVVLSGYSAGGFGALFNFDRTQIAFGPKTK